MKAEPLVSVMHHHCFLNINWNQIPSRNRGLSPNHTQTHWWEATRGVMQHDKEKNKKTKTYSILYHGPVWITLNSFIWNIKTMKHKPSTKSDSYTCRIIRLLKWTDYTGKQLFFPLWMVKQIQKQIVRCEHDNAIYMLQILPDSRR